MQGKVYKKKGEPTSEDTKQESPKKEGETSYRGGRGERGSGRGERGMGRGGRGGRGERPQTQHYEGKK